MLKRIHFFVITLSVMLTLVSCGSSRTVTAGRGGGVPSKPTVAPSVTGLHPKQQALLKEAEKWLGTPYKYGGDDRKGMDCSGFVVRVYKDALGIKLPRTSRDQSKFCDKVSKKNLSPGDLLFFATTRGSGDVSHVGIYMGGNVMIHSSSSQGVILTDFTSDYYTRTFTGGGVVGPLRAMLDSAPAREDAAPADVPAAAPVSVSQGFTMTPVDALPARKTDAPVGVPESGSKPAGGSVTVPVVEPVKVSPAVVTEPVTVKDQPAPVAEPSVEDARSAVLNSLKEKKF